MLPPGESPGKFPHPRSPASSSYFIAVPGQRSARPGDEDGWYLMSSWLICRKCISHQKGFFSDVKLGRSVLGAMAAWASKMDMFDHNVNLVWVMFC